VSIAERIKPHKPKKTNKEGRVPVEVAVVIWWNEEKCQSVLPSCRISCGKGDGELERGQKFRGGVMRRKLLECEKRWISKLVVLGRLLVGTTFRRKTKGNSSHRALGCPRKVFMGVCDGFSGSKGGGKRRQKDLTKKGSIWRVPKKA